MSDGNDARREEREPQGPRSPDAAREPGGGAMASPAPSSEPENGGSSASGSGNGGSSASGFEPGNEGSSASGSGNGGASAPGFEPESGASPAPGPAREGGTASAPGEAAGAAAGAVAGATDGPGTESVHDGASPAPGAGSRGASAAGSGDEPEGPARPYGTGPHGTRLHALVTPREQEPKHTHAGNGTVNHGLDEQSPDGLDPDELELRTLLHQAVREVEPSDGTLDYLRRAVPARRARKRQALVGAAAAALFLGTAVPALVHVSSTGGPDANPSAVGHASQAQGGTGSGKGTDGGESTTGGPSDEVEGSGKGDKKDKDKEEGGSTSSGSGTTEGAGPSAGTASGVPACTAAELGPAAASTAAPDSTGAVYGSFRVTNVSGASCTVDGPGVVGATPQGAADPAAVGSMRHVAGDAAAGLPDPSLEAAQLVLKPGAAYEVRFAWVPSQPCPAPGEETGGGTGGPSSDPSPSDPPTTTSGTSTGTDSGTTTQLVREDGTTDGSVAVTYTASTGSSSATTTVSNACTGTVYWTGLLTAM
ncbi:hypothetical protein RKD24_003593 [Streptomyces calvus]